MGNDMVLLLANKLVHQTVRILELFGKYPQFRNTDNRLDNMEQQLGGIFKYFKTYSKVYGILSDGYKAEARLCMANLLIQIELFCVSIGWDVNTLRDEGYKHLIEKIEEVEAKGGKMI